MSQPNTKFCVHYQLYDQENRLLEATEVEAPHCFTAGESQFFPKVEAALSDCKAGDSISLTLSPEDAFGERLEEHVKLMDRVLFDNTVAVEAGAIIGFETQNGDEIAGQILDFSEAVVEVDFNHPLAGKVIRCEVEVVSASPFS